MVCFYPLTDLFLLWLAYFSPPFFLWILCFALILHWMSLLSLCIPFVVLLCFFFIWFSICVGFFLLSFSYFSLEFFECIFFASLAFSFCFLLSGSDGFSPPGCPCLFPCHGLEAFPQLAGWSVPGSCPFLLPGPHGKLSACTTVTCQLCFAMTSDPVSVPCNMCAFCVLMEGFIFFWFWFSLFLFFVCLFFSSILISVLCVFFSFVYFCCFFLWGALWGALCAWCFFIL